MGNALLVRKNQAIDDPIIVNSDEWKAYRVCKAYIDNVFSNRLDYSIVYGNLNPSQKYMMVYGASGTSATNILYGAIDLNTAYWKKDKIVTGTGSQLISQIATKITNNHVMVFNDISAQRITTARIPYYYIKSVTSTSTLAFQGYSEETYANFYNTGTLTAYALSTDSKLIGAHFDDPNKLSYWTLIN